MSIDGESPLQRSFGAALLEFVINNPLFEAMRCGIGEGNILPALRKQEVHFYEAGARLLRFTGKDVSTHTRYIDKQGHNERPIRICERNPETLEEIRRTAKCHRTQKKADSELVAVHQLFREYAITRSQHRPGELALIDVEARFASGEKLPSGMIDLVFLLPDYRLLFMEAKCIGNSAVKSETEAKVVCQVRNYSRHIKRPGVLDAMNRSLCAQSKLTGRNLGLAKCIVPQVPVLILDPDHRGPSRKSKGTWLSKKLETATDWSFDPGSVDVIDGMSNPPAAIRSYVSALMARSPA